MYKISRSMTHKITNNLRAFSRRCVCISSTCQSTFFASHFSYGRNKSLLYVNNNCWKYIRCSSSHPTHNRVLLPALSPTMEMGTIISWAKKEGDKLSEGDLLAEIETDKATMGFETPEEGYLAKIVVPAGSKNIPIGKLVCIIVENLEDVAAFNSYAEEPEDGSAPSEPQITKPKEPTSSSPTTKQLKLSTSPFQLPTFPIKKTDRIMASPLAKRLASERGLDLSSISGGSGLYGSITSKDLSKASTSTSVSRATTSSPGTHEDRPVSSVSNAIAKRLDESKKTIPHYYLTVDLNLDKILALQAKMNEKLEKEGIKLTVNDFLIKATALASMKVPEVNSAWMETFIRQYNSVDVCVAVSSDGGNYTPVIFEAELKGLVEISNTVKDLEAKARDGTLQPQEYQGGTISVSNLGMFNVKSVASIINPPQSCVLGIGSIQKQLVPTSDGGTKVSSMLQVTLSCDHRVVDGAVGAQWLIAFRKFVEEPYNMLL